MARAEIEQLGVDLGASIMKHIEDAQTNAPRTLQSEARVLGMSELGGCREYIRATIAGDPGEREVGLKWAAMVGTLLGDGIEALVKAADDRVITQHRLTLELMVGRTRVMVSGSADLIYRGYAVADLKSRDGLAGVRRYGPSFKERVQISGYLVAAIQEGILDVNSFGTLVYYDRSGKEAVTHTWTVDYEQALRILESAAERLSDVEHALETAQHATRDEAESYCKIIKCPFYSGCWSGYEADSALESERDIENVQRYIEARNEEAAAAERKEELREALRGVEGITPDGTVVQWKVLANGAERLEVRTV